LPRVLEHGELDVLLDGGIPARGIPARGGHVASPVGSPEAMQAALRARDDAVLELLYGCGLRVAELCGLDIGDVDLPSRTVTAWGKGKRQRRVPMHDRCA